MVRGSIPRRPTSRPWRPCVAYDVDLATLIVSSDDPDDGTAVAELTGTATAS
jgi:hypothetical protein